MKKATYMSSNELRDYLAVGILAGEAEAIANRTDVPEWRKRLRTASTLCSKVINERAEALDKKQLLTVARRNKNTELIMKSVDQKRLPRVFEKEVSISCDDLYDLLDYSLLECYSCPQGEACVGKCHMREVYHRLGVEPLRMNPLPGQCEFRGEDKPMAIAPDYKRTNLVIFGINDENTKPSEQH